jgi:predicted secreted hydrolase
VVATSPPATGFARAEGPRPLDFPADHSAHPDYQTEWWTYTGNLEAADGRHFGYQLTFFHLDDGGELIVYQFRKQDGSIDAYSSGTYIDLQGQPTHLNDEDFTVDATATWRSPHSGAEYPAHWTIAVPKADLTFEVVPHLPDQELDGSFTYWEGAVRITGERAGQSVAEDGYVELTGHAHSMQGQL